MAVWGTSGMAFLDKLRASVSTRDSLLCVGLDPEINRLPRGIPRSLEGVARFNRELIEATAGLVCAFKPNLAFYEALGTGGWDVLRDTLRAVPPDVVTIGDGKRADIGNTSRAYARALFDYLGFDAVTVSPFLGADAVQPFFEDPERGVFVLCRTSNPGASDVQSVPVLTDAGPRPLYELIATVVAGWTRNGNAGLVVGATAPEDLARVRALAPNLPFLVPGVGTQAGDLGAAVAAHRDNAPAVINASRSVAYASSGEDYAAAAERSARALRDAMRQLQGA